MISACWGSKPAAASAPLTSSKSPGAGDGEAYEEVVYEGYGPGGVAAPLEGGQRRFATASPESYWEQMDRLAERLDPATQSLGVVAHSIRAAPIDDIVQLHEDFQELERLETLSLVGNPIVN